MAKETKTKKAAASPKAEKAVKAPKAKPAKKEKKDGPKRALSAYMFFAADQVRNGNLTGVGQADVEGRGSRTSLAPSSDRLFHCAVHRLPWWVLLRGSRIVRGIVGSETFPADAPLVHARLACTAAESCGVCGSTGG